MRGIVLVVQMMLWAYPQSADTSASRAVMAEPYLHTVTAELSRQWPQNRTVNVVCHGHSVPAGYFRTPGVVVWNSR